VYDKCSAVRKKRDINYRFLRGIAISSSFFFFIFLQDLLIGILFSLYVVDVDFHFNLSEAVQG